jgi:hypothetical protein
MLIPETEADFIEAMHDGQMRSENFAESLFYRMHKEMTPVIAQILQEQRDKPDEREAFASVAYAYAQFIASSTSAIAEIIGGENRDSLAKTILEAAAEFLNKGLAEIKQKTL